MTRVCKLVLLERNIDNMSSAGTDRSDTARFEVLPFCTIPLGDVTPRSSYIVTEFESFPIDQLYLLRGIDWLLKRGIDVLNLSLGPIDKTYDPGHPLQIATRFAHKMGISVVVAAGNRGPALSTLQPLAQAPWVIAVGAVDATGRLVDSSSRGDPKGPQPTVVADGSLPVYDERFPKPATSFAAPKVAGIVAWIRKSLELLITDLADQQQDKWSLLSHPVKLPIEGIADTGVDPDKVPSVSPLAASILNTGSDSVKFARTAREHRWYETLMNALHIHRVSIEVAADPDTTRRVLQRMARPLKGYASHEVGAGFISLAEVEHCLSTFTPSRFIEWLCPEAAKDIPEQTMKSLNDTLGPLWDSNKCLALRDFFLGGIRIVVCKVT